jgi:hypothetical protein
MVRSIAHIFLFCLFINSAHGQVEQKKIGSLPAELKETSGLIYYQNKYLLSHNDGGNPSELFVLNLKGELVKKIEIFDTKNRDWEDITQDHKGRVFIGDFGNNDNERKECSIYILPQNFIDQKEVLPEKISFTYEDQNKYPPKPSELNYDCEGFICHGDKIFLFTKCRTKPFTGESRIYELPAKKGNHTAKYKGSVFLCDLGWQFCSVTSAASNANGQVIVLLTYSKLFILTNFDNSKFWKANIHSIALPLVKQREAICFGEKNNLYMTDEYKMGFGGGNLYELTFNLKKTDEKD